MIQIYRFLFIIHKIDGEISHGLRRIREIINNQFYRNSSSLSICSNDFPFVSGSIVFTKINAAAANNAKTAKSHCIPNKLFTTGVYLTTKKADNQQSAEANDIAAPFISDGYISEMIIHITGANELAKKLM